MMKANSVRDLKEELFADDAPPAVLLRSVGARSVSPQIASSLAAAHARPPGRFSLGVAKGGRRGDYRLGVRIHATGREAKQLEQRCRASAKGEVEVRVVPRVVAGPPDPRSARVRTGPARGGASFRRRRRPVEAGLSLGHPDITAGTFGFVVEDSDAYYVLSNNHVLAAVNAAAAGDPIFQPGPADAMPRIANVIALLDRYVPISLNRENLVDCALASLLSSLSFYVGWTEALPGRVRGVRALDENDLGRRVLKAGRTTGVTEGFITQVEVDRLRVDMGEPGVPRVASFSRQFEVEGLEGPFSLGGDSGSLIVDEDGYAIGLLFAGGPDERGVDLTYANDIATVLTKLGVRLVL